MIKREIIEGEESEDAQKKIVRVQKRKEKLASPKVPPIEVEAQPAGAAGEEQPQAV